MKTKRKIEDHSEQIRRGSLTVIKCKNNSGEIAFRDMIYSIPAKNGEEFIFVNTNRNKMPVFKSVVTGNLISSVGRMTVKAYLSK